MHGGEQKGESVTEAKKKRAQRGTRRAAKVERTIARQAAVKTSPRIHSESHSHSRRATRPGKCQRRRFHDERRRRGPPCPLLRSRQYVTANKRVAAIGGANAHSRLDRLSFVTSFTVSNDTHCFWTPSSYANRAPGTDSLYYSPFLLRPPYFPPPPLPCSFAPFSFPVSILATLARSISSSFHRARPFWLSYVVLRRLNSIC